jgi:hypothetical protein
MSEFSSIGHFVAHLAVMEAQSTLALHHGLVKCAAAIEKTSKAEFGVYQPEVSPFAAWAPLADATQAERERLGFTPDDPLLRKGDLRESISHQVHALEAVIGSDSDVMVYQELGTDRIPPRAALGPAAIRNKALITRTLGLAVAEGLLYGSGHTVSLLE